MKIDNNNIDKVKFERMIENNTESFTSEWSWNWTLAYEWAQNLVWKRLTVVENRIKTPLHVISMRNMINDNRYQLEIRNTFVID